MKQYEVNDISQFSSNDEVCLATVGKYAKYQTSTYRLDIVKDICFIHTFKDAYLQTIEIPDHYPFSFTDDNGTHMMNENQNNLTVTGIATISFIVK